MHIKLNEIASAVGGVLYNCDCEKEITGVTIDSREIKEGNLFVAIIGETFDGHNFVKTAIESGCICAIVNETYDEDICCIKVKDTLKALQDLAKYYKEKCNIPVVAVTGSTGKTSTKEMISFILEGKYNVHKTKKNFNNAIGLPLSVMEIEEDDDIAVLEMGMNSLGEIEVLADIAKPNIGVITNVGTAHIENLGTRENILKAKMEITTYFDKDSILIVNGDDEYLNELSNLGYKMIRTSLTNKGDYNAEDIINLGDKGVEFSCVYMGQKYRFRLSIPGIHNVYNALVGIAIGEIYNIPIEKVIDGINNFRPGKLRMDIIELNSGIKIINDCYNANVDSMKAALNILGDYNAFRRIAILGDMFELGNYSEDAHREIGRFANAKCDILITLGNWSKYMNEESADRIISYHFNDRNEAFEFIKSIIEPKDVILIKASRGMKFEEITDFIIGQEERN